MSDQPKKNDKPIPKKPFDDVEEADKGSFPASDAPGWTRGLPEKPHERPKKKKEE